MSDQGARLFEQLMRFRPDGLTANAWAVRAGVSRTIWSDLRRHGNPSRRTLEKLLAAVGSSLAEFEALRVGPAMPSDDTSAVLTEPGGNWRGASPATLPVIRSQPAGLWGDPALLIEKVRLRVNEVVSSLARPASLQGDKAAYAVIIVGDSMWPRFRAGRRLIVSPGAAVETGDDVLVELGDGTALLKELVHQRADSVELRQFNPDATFEVAAAEVAAIHKVLGEAI